MRRITTVFLILLHVFFLQVILHAQQSELEELRVQNGYSLVVNPIDQLQQRVYNILGRVPEGTIVFLFDSNRQIYTFNQFQKGFWLNPHQLWPAGLGALIYNPTNPFAVSFSSFIRYQLTQPSLVRGLNLIDAAAIRTFGPQEDDTLFRLEAQFRPYLYSFGEWVPSLPGFLTNEAVFYRPASGPEPIAKVRGGTLLFCNYVPGLGLDSPVSLDDGTRVSGADGAVIQLWCGPSQLQLEPIGPPIGFLEGALAGYFNGGVVEIPSVPPGSTAFVELRLSLPNGFGASVSTVVSLGGGFLPPGVLNRIFFPGPIGTPPIFALSRGVSTPPFSQRQGGSDNTLLRETLCGQTITSARYYFLVSRDGGEGWVSTAGSPFDSIVSVFKVAGHLSSNSFEQVACNDDRRIGDKTSEVVFPAQPRTSYLVAVGRRDGVPYSEIEFQYGLRESQTFTEEIPVPNGSFESPPSAFFNTQIDFWARSERPDFWEFGPWESLFGITWNEGKFDNVDGNQYTIVYSQPSAALFQHNDSADLKGATRSFPETYQVDKAYHLTVSLYGDDWGGFRSEPLRYGLYYRDDACQSIRSATFQDGSRIQREPEPAVVADRAVAQN